MHHVKQITEERYIISLVVQLLNLPKLSIFYNRFTTWDYLSTILLFATIRSGTKCLQTVVITISGSGVEIFRIARPTWWRHQVEIFSALLYLCVGNSSVNVEFPAHRPVTRGVDVYLICAPIHGWVNNGEAGDLRRYRAQYEVIVVNTLTADIFSNGSEYIRQANICLPRETSSVFGILVTVYCRIEIVFKVIAIIAATYGMWITVYVEIIASSNYSSMSSFFY